MHRLNGLFRLAILAVFLAIPTGCATDLQLDYVESMEATHAAITIDVEAGLYKADAKAKATLKAWAQANADARKALVAEGKAEKKAKGK